MSCGPTVATIVSVICCLLHLCHGFSVVSNRRLENRRLVVQLWNSNQGNSETSDSSTSSPWPYGPYTTTFSSIRHVAGDGSSSQLSAFAIFTELETLNGDQTDGIRIDYFSPKGDDEPIQISNWSGGKFYSDYIKEGIEYKQKQEPTSSCDPDNVVMLFESPGTSTSESSFHNANKFRLHDWPPPKSTKGKEILQPNRYASMTGASYPTFLRDGAPPPGLMEHWQDVIPGFVRPSFVSSIDTNKDAVYAYLPVEKVKHHVNDPDTHYHLVGKDAIHLMTEKTTRLLPDTYTQRPCVVKTTHSMGSRGIFIIRDEDDLEEFEQFFEESGNPSYVVTDYVHVDRNVACHFFMHPDGSVTWFGSNENIRNEDGTFSLDSYMLMDHQETLKEMQTPFVEDVVRYCQKMGFWGFCGIDVLFDSSGDGYLVDVNPRVTGSCPALMTLQLLHQKYGFMIGLFRRSGEINYYGSAEELLGEVQTYNEAHCGESCIVIHSMFEPDGEAGSRVRVNIGVYGNDLAECKQVLNQFAQPFRQKLDAWTALRQNYLNLCMYLS